ncbi:Malonyl-CoA:anthocyanidin 5-O-glucoside-6''-O-malonyltransferase [Linum grandiflorum]
MGSASEASTPVTTVTVIELCRISPSSSNLTSTTNATFQLTYFDLYWFRTPPVERHFFYSLPPSSSADVFYSDVLPTLKLSLSAALSYFNPLSASLTWPSDSPKPFFFYDSSSSAGVSLTVAESAADFNILISSDQTRSSLESHPYIPVLPSSDSEADVIALQITVFPNQGFCIGVSNHHAVLDGKSATLFIKAWAHLSSNGPSFSCSLPQELTPFLDRSIVQDREGIDHACLDFWTGLAHPGMGNNPDPRSFKLAPSFIDSNLSNSVRVTLIHSYERIQKLRERLTTRMMMKNYSDNNKKIRLSSFAITFAHSLICLVKAKRLGIGSDADRKVVYFGFPVDARGRLKPPLPVNYIGNCVIGCHELIEIDQLVKEEEGAIEFVVERISRMIDDVEERATVEKDNLAKFMRNLEASSGIFIGIAGSPRFNVYGADFGLGRPKSVEVTSIDRTGAISMAECGDGSRGIEIGLALTPPEMELFRFAFEA